MTDRTPVNGHYFLSYSRRQFYFAESVVLGLQEAGFKIWFDVQDLAPGEAWRHEIETGRDEAAGIIVIVSRASMASEWVRKEWEPVLKDGKRPVYLVVFEEAPVPQKLMDGATAVIDMRGNFNRSLKRLIGALRGEDVKTMTRVPSRRLFGLPRRIPLTVGFIIAMLTINALLLILLVIFSFFIPAETSPVGTLLLFALWGYFISDTVLDFLRRDHTFRQVWIAILLTLPLAYFYWFLAIPTALALLAHFLSPGTYRWLPTGEAPAWMRRRFGLGTIPSLRDVIAGLDAHESPTCTHYAITHAPEDASIAGTIEEILAEGGHVRVSLDTPDNADQHIVILSNHTPEDDVRDLVRKHSTERLTPVLVCNVDARDAVEELGDFQFVDFRQQADEQLEAISLLYRHPEEGKIAYGMNTLPISTSMLRWPRGVRRFNTLNHLTYLFYVFWLLVFIIPAVESVIRGEFVFDAVAIFFIFIWSLLLAGHVWLADAVQKRLISYSRYRRRMMILAGFSLFSLSFAVPQAVVFFTTRGALRRYLPGNTPRKPGQSRVRRLPQAARAAAVRRALLDAGVVAAVVITLYVDDIMNALP